MELKNEYHSFIGMLKDIAVSKHPSNMLVDALNIKIASDSEGTQLTITNVRTNWSTEKTIKGNYLGHCILNKYLVVFSTDSWDDYIERFDLTDLNAGAESLYEGGLRFSLAHPIEAIGYYESETVLKVYWTDGYNLPRVINIVAESLSENYFNFIPELLLEEEISVKKLFGMGSFPAGVIKYAFTYYNKFGHESNIFDTTPQFYISHFDRGGAPDEKIANTFQITVKKCDEHFDYLRIYSILRTSLNGTPLCKRVADVYLRDVEKTGGYINITVTDDGTIGDDVDPTELLYKNRETFTAETIELKDNTLFFGNLGLIREEIDKDELVGKFTILSTNRMLLLNSTLLNSNNTDAYINQLSTHDLSNTYCTPCVGFKRGNYYRLGVLFLYKTGLWSLPFFISDERVSQKPYIDWEDEYNSFVLHLPKFVNTLAASLGAYLTDKGYKRVRPVVVLPEPKDRVVLALGVVCPAVYTSEEVSSSSYTNSVLSSWLFRPKYGNLAKEQSAINGTVAPWSAKQNYPNRSSYLLYTDSSATYSPDEIRRVEILGYFNNAHKFQIYNYTGSNGFSTFHTPELEFTANIDNEILLNTHLNTSIGKVVVNTTNSSIYIETSTPTINGSSLGVWNTSFSQTGVSLTGSLGIQGIVSGLYYEDWVVNDAGDSKIEYDEDWKSPVKWMVYMWLRSGSLNNDINRDGFNGTLSAVLKKKVISNLRICKTLYNSTIDDSGTTALTSVYSLIFNSDLAIPIKLKDYTDSGKTYHNIYYGNVDTLLVPDSLEGLYFAFFGESRELLTGTPVTNSVRWKTGAEITGTGTTAVSKAGIYNYKKETSSSPFLWTRVYDDTGENIQQLAVGKSPIRMRYKSSPHIVADYIPTLNVDSNYSAEMLIAEITQTADSSDARYRSNMFGGTSEDALRANLWIPCGEPAIINSNGVTRIHYNYGDTYFQRWDCLKTYPFSFDDINQVVEIGSFMLESYVNLDGRYDRNRGLVDNTNVSPQNFNLMNMVYSQTDNFFNYRIPDVKQLENTRFPNQIAWTLEKHPNEDIDSWTGVTLASTLNLDGSKGEIKSLNLWKDTLYCFLEKSISQVLFNSRVQIPVSDGVPIEIANNYKVDGFRLLTDGIGCINKFTIKETPSGIYFIDAVSNNLYLIGEGVTDISTTKNMSSWFKDHTINRVLYDDVNHDVYCQTSVGALCFSEVLGLFTSINTYLNSSSTPTYLLESYNGTIVNLTYYTLYRTFLGEYSSNWYIQFISNGYDDGLLTLTKTFSNIDYRMAAWEDNEGYLKDSSFTNILVYNDYQDTTNISLVNTKDRPSNLKKKFSVWRIDIPRNKAVKGQDNYKTTGRRDRIRHPWCKIQLGVNSSYGYKTIVLDINVLYYI